MWPSISQFRPYEDTARELYMLQDDGSKEKITCTPCEVFNVLLGFPKGGHVSGFMNNPEYANVETIVVRIDIPSKFGIPTTRPTITSIMIELCMYYFWCQTEFAPYVQSDGRVLSVNLPPQYPIIQEGTSWLLQSKMELPVHPRVDPGNVTTYAYRRLEDGASCMTFSNGGHHYYPQNWDFKPQRSVLQRRFPDEGGTVFQFTNDLEHWYPRNSYIPKELRSLRLGDVYVEYATEACAARQAEETRREELDKESNIEPKESPENSPSASSSPGPPISPGLQDPYKPEDRIMSHHGSRDQVEEPRERPEIQMEDLLGCPNTTFNSPRALSDSSPFTMNQLMKRDVKVKDENSDNDADENHMTKELPRDWQSVGRRHKRSQSAGKKKRKATKKREKMRKRKHRERTKNQGGTINPEGQIISS